jgi:hypothetical protein
VREEHDAKHEEEDREEGAKRDEDTFAEAMPAAAVELAIFGANVGLEGRGYFFRVNVVHLIFLGDVSLGLRKNCTQRSLSYALLYRPSARSE